MILPSLLGRSLSANMPTDFYIHSSTHTHRLCCFVSLINSEINYWFDYVIFSFLQQVSMLQYKNNEAEVEMKAGKDQCTSLIAELEEAHERILLLEKQRRELETQVCGYLCFLCEAVNVGFFPLIHYCVPV